MADATVKINVVWDFSGVAAGFRQAAEAFDALQAALTPEAPASATDEAHADTASQDPQGP